MTREPKPPGELYHRNQMHMGGKNGHGLRGRVGGLRQIRSLDTGQNGRLCNGIYPGFVPVYRAGALSVV